MGLNEFRGTKYKKYSIPYAIEKSKKLTLALMSMSGMENQAEEIKNEINQFAPLEDENGLVSPSGNKINAFYDDFDDQNKKEEDTSAYKAYLLNNRINMQVQKPEPGKKVYKPLYDLANALSSDKGSLLEACMDNSYLESSVDALSTMLPRINDNNTTAAFDVINGKGPLAPLNELYTGVKDLIELEYTKQTAARGGWQDQSYKNYVKKLNTAQKNTIKAYKNLCNIKNIDQYNNVMSGDDGAKLSDLTDSYSKLGIAMTVLEVSNAALNRGWSPDDCRIFGILAEIECGLNKTKKDYEEYKKAHNENNPEYDNYIAEADKDYRALMGKINAKTPGADMAAVMEGVKAFAEKYKSDNKDNNINERFGFLGNMLSDREKNYDEVKANAEKNFYTDLDRKMELSTRGVYFGTREYDNLRRSVSEFGTLSGTGRTLATEEQKNSYEAVKKNLIKYIVRKEAEIDGKSNPNRNSVMRLNTMKDVFNSLVARFEPKLYDKIRVYKRLGEYAKNAERLNREKKTRPVYQKLHDLNTLIEGHLESGNELNMLQLNELSEKYKTAITAVDSLLLTKKKNNPDLARLAKKLGKDYKTINKYIKSNREAKILDIYERSRAEVLTVEDLYGNEKKGSALSERIKMNLGEKNGFFTAEKPGTDVGKEIVQLRNKIIEQYDLPDDFFENRYVETITDLFEDADSALKPLRSNGPEKKALHYSTIENCRNEVKKKIKQDILLRRGYKKLEEASPSVLDEINKASFSFDTLFGQENQPMSEKHIRNFMGVLEYASGRFSLINRDNIREDIVGNDINASVDRRNSAMSDMADLFGMHGLVVHTENYRIKDKKTGRTIKGIMMDEAKGIDPSNYTQLEDGIKALDPENVSNSLQLKKDIANLQILDYICGNMDRHGYNYFFKTDENGKVCGLLGIDNDTSFGVVNDPHIQMSGIAPENMSVIPKSTWEKMQNMSSETMKGMLYGFGLSTEVINKSVKRFEKIKAKIANDQEYFAQKGALKGELADGRIKVVDDEELKNLGFFSQLASGEKKAEQGFKDKNLFEKVMKNSRGSYMENCSIDFFDDYHKCAGTVRKNWAIAGVTIQNTEGLAQEDNAFGEIRNIVAENKFVEGMTGMTKKSNRINRGAMYDKLRILKEKCNTYLENNKTGVNASAEEKKKIKIVKKLGNIADTMISAVEKAVDFEGKIKDYKSVVIDDKKRNAEYKMVGVRMQEDNLHITKQGEQLVQRLDTIQKAKQKPNAGFLEKERDRLRLSLVDKMHKVTRTDTLNGAGELSKAVEEIATDLIVLKAIEKNLAKGKKGEIRYCGIDVTNENTLANTRKALLDKGEVTKLAKIQNMLNFNDENIKLYAEKLMGVKIKKKTPEEKFLEKVDETIAKNKPVEQNPKPKGSKTMK